MNGWTKAEGDGGLGVQSDIGGANLIVNLQGGVPKPSDSVNYTVMDTDYETYSVVYSCEGFRNLASFDFFWILAREEELDEATIMSIVAKV